MSKRTLDSFFKPTTPKRPKLEQNEQIPPTISESSIPTNKPPSQHPSYPIPIPQLPSHIEAGLQHSTPFKQPTQITNQPHLDLLHYTPYLPRPTANELFKFLRHSLPFYRVRYTARRGPISTEINTPRWTTVFGVDETSLFKDDKLVDSKTGSPISPTKYQCTPRPIPECLEQLRREVEAHAQDGTGEKGYNFCLVNYYGSGEDSIAFHSDDERFLGARPNIASLSLGGERDFLMKHKPVLVAPGATGPGSPKSSTATVPVGRQIKMSLGSGDMVVMRGETQANWLHSIPKRKGSQGRINITFRRAVVPAGTNNYYHYNVGSGKMYRWDDVSREMVEK
ncbi:Oxoglutarate/iron-dependent dioxygenase [Penicillium soppii]|jgi:alkylated DNA repair dioxygenase AlkB|uniref:Oxoglutarate/iron-dependent dioxygenase n=1 Tax=Penicillium soppii TaxID=69789 RepID=UPI0025466AF6|nr:Oxoglutarate/iron-dependent dioxygenase [Penicillium soppii]KAJ5852661.1 Oxoglutarate/iron-dependent dioxygenase [Penicillium soppii]